MTRLEDSARTEEDFQHVFWKQIMKGDYIDAIYNCPFEMHELVTDEDISSEIFALKDSEQLVLKAVYLPKNHFIKAESMTTEKYLSYFFPFDKIDFRKKGMESSWSTNSVEMMALIMSMKDKQQAVIMSFQKEYAERYDWP